MKKTGQGLTLSEFICQVAMVELTTPTDKLGFLHVIRAVLHVLS